MSSVKPTLWELHMHTSETSACGINTAAEMAARYKALGFHGMVVTDHFVNANCVMPKAAPWQARIDGLLKGYLAAKAAGDAIGLAVLMGFEYYNHGADYLTFGVPESFLRDQSDLCDIPLEAYVHRVRAAGGIVIQAHPYREAWYLPEDVAQRWDIVDAFEVINGSHGPMDHLEWDAKALETAARHGLIQTGGSDAHSVARAGMAATAFAERFDTAEALVAALRAGQGQAVRLSETARLVVE